MKMIELTQGKCALVEDELYEELNQDNWFYIKKGYAVRNVRKSNGKQTLIYMHRQIMNAPDRVEVDHANGNKLDNRRFDDNGNPQLRLATHSQNQYNRVEYENNTSGCKGVNWDTNSNKWRAQIQVNKKRLHLGLFDDVNEASKVYKEAAIEYHGEFSNGGK